MNKIECVNYAHFPKSDHIYSETNKFTPHKKLPMHRIPLTITCNNV